MILSIDRIPYYPNRSSGKQCCCSLSPEINILLLKCAFGIKRRPLGGGNRIDGLHTCLIGAGPTIEIRQFERILADLI